MSLHGDRGARGDRRQGFGQTAADEQRGVDTVGESADLGDRGLQQPGGLDEQRLISVVFGATGKLDEHRQRDEVLLGAVMQVTFEAAPFLVGGGDQPGT